MKATILGLELLRQFRAVIGLFFIVVLPGFFYLIFGASMDFSQDSAGNGNVAMYIMISMAAYGAVVATISIGSETAVERMQGWGRQLGLTPLRDSSYVLTKAVVAVLIATLPIGVIYALGVLTGAEGTSRVWLLSALITVLGAGLFALWGLVWGLAIKSESAVAVASGSTMILAFLGNLFFPLSGVLLDIARFTPLYGYASLARYPLTEGWMANTTGAPAVHEPLWIPLTNVAVWTLILSAVCLVLVRRSRARQ